MRASLSIIIPTLNNADILGPRIEALFEGLDCGLVRELVLSDGGSEDDIKTLAEGLGARFVQGVAGRGGQLGRGAAAANGAWFLFLHADTHLEAGWSRVVMRQIEQHPDRAAAFRLAFDMPGFAPRFVAGWANIRSLIFALPYGDQGLLISRQLYDRIGGFPDIPLMEDVAISRALGRRLCLLQSRAVTSGQKYAQSGWFRKGARNLWTLARYFMGVSPQHLAIGYRR